MSAFVWRSTLHSLTSSYLVSFCVSTAWLQVLVATRRYDAGWMFLSLSRGVFLRCHVSHPPCLHARDYDRWLAMEGLCNALIVVPTQIRFYLWPIDKSFILTRSFDSNPFLTVHFRRQCLLCASQLCLWGTREESRIKLHAPVSQQTQIFLSGLWICNTEIP